MAKLIDRTPGALETQFAGKTHQNMHRITLTGVKKPPYQDATNTERPVLDND